MASEQPPAPAAAAVSAQSPPAALATNDVTVTTSVAHSVTDRAIGVGDVAEPVAQSAADSVSQLVPAEPCTTQADAKETGTTETGTTETGTTETGATPVSLLQRSQNTSQVRSIHTCMTKILAAIGCGDLKFFRI